MFFQSGPYYQETATEAIPACFSLQIILKVIIEVPRVEYDKLTDDWLGEKSEDIKAREEKALEVQHNPFAGM